MSKSRNYPLVLIIFAFCLSLTFSTYIGNSWASIAPSMESVIPVGNFPYGVAISPNNRYALVTNSDDDNVSVINMATKGVVASVKVGSHPTGVAIAPSLTFAYVCNAASGNVSVINLSTLTKAININTGGEPMNVVFSPDSRTAFVANMHDNQVDVINTMQNAVVKRIDVGRHPFGLAISPDGKTLIVTNSGGSSISVINISALTVTRTMNVAENPTGIAFSPEGGPVDYFYVASGKKSEIFVYSAKNYGYIGKFKTLKDPSSLALTPDGTMLFVVNYQDLAATVYSAAHFIKITTIQLTSGPMSVAVSPDGTAALITDTNGAAVSYIKIRNRGVSVGQAPVRYTYSSSNPAAVSSASAPSSPAPTPVNPFPVVSAPITAPPVAAASPYPGGTPVTVPAYGAPATNYVPQPFGEIATVYTGKSPTALAVTPDEKYLYVVDNTENGEVSVIDISKDEVVKTIKVGGYPSAITISPDGHYCFVVNSGSGTVTIISTGEYY